MTQDWYGPYLGHLKSLAGFFGKNKGRPDLQALAELRAAARGGSFEIRALRHIVPHLGEDDPYRDHHVRVGLIVGQLFAACRPDDSETDPEATSGGRSMGRLLGEADGSPSTESGEGGRHTLSAMERHLQTVAAADFDQLGPRLRGTLARLKQSRVSPGMADYRRLFRDLTHWNSEKKKVQYAWVKDFYSARYRSEPDGKTNKS